MSKYLELVCPAGTPAALRAAVDARRRHGLLRFSRDATNARNYPGLNFDPDELAEGVVYAHKRNCRVLVAVNTFPRAGDPGPWRRAIDNAAASGADAVILADLGVLDYAATHHPELRRHLSVQAAAASPHAIRFYRETFAISRVVLPRVLSIDEVRALIGQIGIEAEVFAFGSLGTMVEGRCFISSYITGCSPSSDGACAPAAHVSYREEDGCLVTRLDDVIMNRFDADEPGRLSHTMQRPLHGARPAALFVRGAGGAERDPIAGRIEGGRRDRAENRRPPAQPRLCGPGGGGIPQNPRCRRVGRGGCRKPRPNCARWLRAAAKPLAPTPKVGARRSKHHERCHTGHHASFPP